MASIKFFVRGEKREIIPVYVRLIIGRETDIICNTKLQASPKEWNNKTQSLRQRILSDNDEIFLTKIKNLRDHIESQIKIYPGEKDKEWLTGVIDSFYNLGNENNLNNYIQNFINRIESGELKNKEAVNYVSGTVRKFKGTQACFNRYQGLYTDEEKAEHLKADKPLRKVKRIDFKDINSEFYQSFVSFLSEEGYKVNTIGRFVKDLKHIMHQALIEDLHNNRSYEDFSVFSEDSHAIYLNLDEVDKIWKHKIEDKRIELARDCFITLCETALRISDYKQINVGIRKIKGTEFIDIYQQKTNERVIIPLTPRMKAILNKYNGKLPYIHENYVNEYIKTVAFQCELTEVVSWPAQKKGLKYTASSPKWKLVTCHTGRRTAATNMYLAGIPILDIMKITGHKTERSFLKYIRVTIEETAIKLSEHPFFKMKAV